MLSDDNILVQINPIRNVAAVSQNRAWDMGAYGGII